MRALKNSYLTYSIKRDLTLKVKLDYRCQKVAIHGMLCHARCSGAYSAKLDCTLAHAKAQWSRGMILA